MYEAIEEPKWSTEWRELYKAIASFKNDTAFRLLKVPFTQTKYPDIRKYHIDFIFGAVQEFYTPVYDEILWEMWENENNINNEIFVLLYPKKSGKSV